MLLVVMVRRLLLSYELDYAPYCNISRVIETVSVMPMVPRRVKWDERSGGEESRNGRWKFERRAVDDAHSRVGLD